MADDENILLRDVDREVYRTMLVSLFWTIIQDKKNQPDGYRLKDLADALGIDKSQVSRWFSDIPNWEANTVADIANALDIELIVQARSRRTGQIYSPKGPSEPIRSQGEEERPLPKHG